MVVFFFAVAPCPMLCNEGLMQLQLFLVLAASQNKDGWSPRLMSWFSKKGRQRQRKNRKYSTRIGQEAMQKKGRPRLSQKSKMSAILNRIMYKQQARCQMAQPNNLQLAAMSLHICASLWLTVTSVHVCSVWERCGANSLRGSLEALSRPRLFQC